MKKNISLLLLSHSGAPVRQMTLSKTFIGFICFCLLGGGIGVGVIVYDYTFLRTQAVDNQSLKSKVNDQFDQITGQRKEIQTFAQAINKLKLQLVQLDDFENEVRRMAKIDKSDSITEPNDLFGVGGAMPDDLNPQIPLTEKHDDLIEEMYEQVVCIDNALSGQKKQFSSLINGLDDKLEILASTPSIHPCRGRITSGFGYRKSPFKSKKLAFHKGYDIATKSGTPIRATANGVVIFSGYKGPLGRLITIDHGNRITTSYGHARKLLKKKGDVVKRGDIIAKVGTSGRTTGAHVHYEVRIKDIPVNPEKFFLD
ncbi:M23 family metallopeptidase [Desulfococcaceae bacterium HSG9]|nr:M23 family metallopeptidase [Desulfococcaceae bacterium HSG9]